MKLLEVKHKALPEPVLTAFLKLGDEQRGEPESQMLRVQTVMGGGVLSPVVEHVGDLTHRMTHMLRHGIGYSGQEYVEDKTKKAIRWLSSGYGFARELEENIKSNARYRGIEEAPLREKINAELLKYAEAHAKLTVYNRLQWLAREAAVAVGNQQWDLALQYLTDLHTAASTKAYAKEAIQYKLDKQGKPVEFTKDKK